MHGFQEGDRVKVYGVNTDNTAYTSGPHSVEVFDSNNLHLDGFTVPKPLPDDFYLEKKKSDDGDLGYGLDRYPYMWLTGGRATGCAC